MLEIRKLPVLIYFLTLIGVLADFEKYENIPQEWEPPTPQVNDFKDYISVLDPNPYQDGHPRSGPAREMHIPDLDPVATVPIKSTKCKYQ